jgi:hypothetical protein
MQGYFLQYSGSGFSKHPENKKQDIPFLKILLSTSYREIFSIEQYQCGDVFAVFRIRIQLAPRKGNARYSMFEDSA